MNMAGLSNATARHNRKVRYPVIVAAVSLLAMLVALVPQDSTAASETEAASVSATSDNLRAGRDHWQAEMLGYVNETRSLEDVPPVRLCPELGDAAQGYAEVMASNDHYSHVGPDGSTPGERAEAAGYEWWAIGENIAKGQGDVFTVMWSWNHSTGHRANIVHPYFQHLGVGLAISPEGTPFWVQKFGGGGECSDSSPFGDLESAIGGRGVIRIEGWAIDPDVRAAPIEVEVSVDGAVVGAFTADVQRSDMQGLWPKYAGSHGFDQSVYSAPGERVVCVTALHVGSGSDTVLGCESVVVEPLTSPDAPSDVNATTSSSQATITWLAPPADGGSPVTAYTVIADPGGATCSTDGDLSCTVSGLLNGSAYTFTVVATNAIGDSDPSASSAPVTPSACGASEPGPFSDVPGEQAFCTQIEWMATQGISGGFNDGTFRPTVAVSRQAMAAFLHRFAGEPEVTLTERFFADVPESHPFFDAIQWMADSGLSTGTAQPGGKPLYNPTAPVSRQAMAAFLFRYAEEPNVDLDQPFFADVSEVHPFYEAIQWMADSGLSTGTAQPSEKPNYLPVNAVSRQAMAAFLQRYDESVAAPIA
jgi:uncharacterized protein YkwD